MPPDLQNIGWQPLVAVISLALIYALISWLSRENTSNPERAGIVGTMIFVSCPIIAMCVAMFIGGLWHGWVEYRMSRSGQVTNAVVQNRVDRIEHSGENPTSVVCLVIEFKDHTGRVWRVERPAEVGRPWSELVSGDPAPAVEFLRDDPATWRFASEAGQWKGLMLGSGAFAILIVGLRVLCRWTARRTRRCT